MYSLTPLIIFLCLTHSFSLIEGHSVSFNVTDAIYIFVIAEWYFFVNDACPGHLITLI